MTGQPARAYSWPPFEPGNDAAMTYGAHSPRRWRPIADRLTAELPGMAPWCSRPTFGAVVAAWARVEAKLHLVSTWLDENGVLDDDGLPRPATGLYAKLEGQAQSLRAELGLTPLSLAKLIGALSAAPAGTDDDGLAKLQAEGAKIIEARGPAALATGEEHDAEA